jgi:hypothetical protein
LNPPAYEPIIDATVDALAELNPEAIIPAHPTGSRAVYGVASRLPDGYIPNSVGFRPELRADKTRRRQPARTDNRSPSPQAVPNVSPLGLQPDPPEPARLARTLGRAVTPLPSSKNPRWLEGHDRLPAMKARHLDARSRRAHEPRDDRG